mgnify:CR=1 FL=1
MVQQSEGVKGRAGEGSGQNGRGKDQMGMKGTKSKRNGRSRNWSREERR